MKMPTWSRSINRPGWYPSGVGGALRPGIVHRLDRFTSGVLLVAKNDAAHQGLAAQFSGRQVEKVYLAMVHGKVAADSGRIDRPIARDPVRRVKMAARLDQGRAAWSEYRVLRRFEKSTFLEVRIGTGRTYQIRVHLSSMGIRWWGMRCTGRGGRMSWGAISCMRIGSDFGSR